MSDVIKAGMSSAYYRMKADQHWDLAGLARQDNDQKDSERHTKLAREYEACCREAKACGV